MAVEVAKVLAFRRHPGPVPGSPAISCTVRFRRSWDKPGMTVLISTNAAIGPFLWHFLTFRLSHVIVLIGIENAENAS